MKFMKGTANPSYKTAMWQQQATSWNVCRNTQFSSRAHQPAGMEPMCLFCDWGQKGDYNKASSGWTMLLACVVVFCWFCSCLVSWRAAANKVILPTCQGLFCKPRINPRRVLVESLSLRSRANFVSVTACVLVLGSCLVVSLAIARSQARSPRKIATLKCKGITR